MTAPAFTVERCVDRWSWAVHGQAGELVCVTLYKRGALEVARRLSARSPEMHGAKSGSPESARPTAGKRGAARVCGASAEKQKSGRSPERVEILRKKSGKHSASLPQWFRCHHRRWSMAEISARKAFPLAPHYPATAIAPRRGPRAR